MQSTSTNTIDSYLQNYSIEVQEILSKIRNLSHQLVENCTESISYGIPTLKYNGKNLVHFAGYNHHISLYPGPQAIEFFKTRLSDYKLSKGTIQFNLDKPIPYKLIEEIIRYRLTKVKIEIS